MCVCGGGGAGRCVHKVGVRNTEERERAQSYEVEVRMLRGGRREGGRRGRGGRREGERRMD